MRVLLRTTPTISLIRYARIKKEQRDKGDILLFGLTSDQRVDIYLRKIVEI